MDGWRALNAAGNNMFFILKNMIFLYTEQLSSHTLKIWITSVFFEEISLKQL